MWLFALPALLINVCVILIPALLTLAGAFFFWDGIGTPVWADALATWMSPWKSCAHKPMTPIGRCSKHA